MQSNEIRQKFLKFFENRGHKIIPSASLVPENDPSVLFTTAGMQQFKPYYTNEKDTLADFGTKNVVSVQKCVRTSDIDEVGDNTHLTFFEMSGNFSFGGYNKKEAITLAWDFITKELNIATERIYVTILDCDSPGKDEESYDVWKNDIGLSPNKIKFGGIDDNFWGPTGNSGPCGPTTEIYVDGVEVWNIVFNQYFSTTSRELAIDSGWQLTKLPFLGVDTGMGLERLLAIIQEQDNIFATDLFEPLLTKINELSTKDDSRAKRIVADHIRTAVFMIADGVTPSNTDRGYILRRILRRAIRYADKLAMAPDSLSQIADVVITKYGGIYPNLKENSVVIKNEINKEENKFRETLEKGLREFAKGRDPFDLYQSFGFPIELTEELAKEKGLTIDRDKFDEELKKHQELSRQGAEQKFKGGLAGDSDQVVKYHTATHLLQQALGDVLGPSVAQKGSNITEERLRFDFAFDRKMTDEEKQKVEEIVNKKIESNLSVNKIVLSKAEAEKTGARHLFGEKYGAEVSIYFIGDSLDTAYSKEFCGGPHVERTSDLARGRDSEGSPRNKKFKITKEETVAAGVRRIKAVLG